MDFLLGLRPSENVLWGDLDYLGRAGRRWVWLESAGCRVALVGI
jgi:hypothetical protein